MSREGILGSLIEENVQKGAHILNNASFIYYKTPNHNRPLECQVGRQRASCHKPLGQLALSNLKSEAVSLYFK